MDEKQPDNEKLQTWWQQSLDNDTAAFGSIHAALFDGLYGYAAKLLNSGELADDTIQDLFIKIWNKRSSIGTIQKIKPFFYTSLRRQVLNQLRDLKLKNLKISLVTQPDIEFSQEEILIKNEDAAGLKEKITALLNTLPARQREVIYLHYFEDLSLTQIAVIMSINHQSAMNLKQRALQKMRTENLLSIFLLLCSLYKVGKF
ncbi:MAG: RNA polymerase sigma factor [Chitinophagaceae bacterium]|nr:RNA polymerase sigma factor [Chitinophagaceae bacterium]